MLITVLNYLFGYANANIDAAIMVSSSTPLASLSWPEMDLNISLIQS